jgi:uncharacterized damage-inducible protein DinB
VILYDDRLELAAARTVDGYAEETLARLIAYRTTSGAAHEQPLGDILAHLFNHQTHHRGQAHACLSILTGATPPYLDLLAFQRDAPGA